MVNLSAKIESSQNSFIRNATTTVDKNNISIYFNEIANQKANGNSPFLLGISSFKDKSTFVNESVDYFISRNVSNDNGEFDSTQTFSFTPTSSTTFIIIYFNLFNKEYPPNVILNNTVSYNLNSPVLCLPVEAGKENTIYIKTWNKPNRPLVIQGIQTFVEIKNSELISVDFSGQDRSDTNLPSWGIKSNSGNLEMFDTYGIIENMRKIGALTNSAINIYLNAGSRQEQIGGFYISNMEKNRQTLKTKINFQDILLSWENIEVRSYLLNEFLEGISSYDFINKILEENDITLVYSRDGEQYIPYPYIEGGPA
jgi:hypothetical protein